MMKFERTIPNYLTIFRLILIPIIIFFLIKDSVSFLLIGLILFVISAITDRVDGVLARRLKQESEFGAFFDPLVDKIFVLSIYIVYIFKDGLMVYWWLVVIILLRDIIITLIRTNFKKRKIEFKTSIIAKTKTVIQMIAVSIIFLYMFITKYLAFKNEITNSAYDVIWKQIYSGEYNMIAYIPLIITIITAIITVLSGFDYLIRYKRSILIDEEKND